MASPRLHLDADTSIKALALALRGRGHDVTRTFGGMLSETGAAEWPGQVRWLNQWRRG